MSKAQPITLVTTPGSRMREINPGHSSAKANCSNSARGSRAWRARPGYPWSASTLSRRTIEPDLLAERGRAHQIGDRSRGRPSIPRSHSSPGARRSVERILAVPDARRAATAERLGAQPRNLEPPRTGRAWLSPEGDEVGHGGAVQAGDVAEQLPAGGVDLDPDRVDAARHHLVQGSA